MSCSYLSAAHRGLDLEHRIDTLWSTYLTVIMEAHKTGFVQQEEHGIYLERPSPRYTARNGRAKNQSDPANRNNLMDEIDNNCRPHHCQQIIPTTNIRQRLQKTSAKR